jgi:NCS1 family nucleobase:cation symporter-1
MQTIRKFADWAGPVVYVAMFALAAWILVKAGSDFSLNFSSKEISTGDSWLQFFTVAALVVTAGSVVVFGEAIRDPVEIVARIDNTFVVIVGALVFTTATMGINIVANYVSPAYDLANVAPKYIGFKRGGLITSVLAVVVMGGWGRISSRAPGP